LDTKKELEQQEEKQEKLYMDEVEHKESQQLAGLDGTINMECGNFVAADERSEMCDKHIEMQFSEDLRTDTSMEHEERKEVFEEKYVSIPPEELSLYYTDPQGMIQGPFLGADIMCWFELGYFGLDLPVRLVDAPEGASFSPLGDVMPHLKIKTETPLEFDAAEPTTEREGQIDETSLMPESLQPIRKIADDSELVVEVPLQPARQIEGNDITLKHRPEPKFCDARSGLYFPSEYPVLFELSSISGVTYICTFLQQTNCSSPNSRSLI
jgi:hypothetical protein